MDKNSKKNKKIIKKVTPLARLCHGELRSASFHPDHSKQIARINRINGQMDGVKQMILEQRYCPEILMQTRAIYSAVRSLEALILEKHLQSCVREAMRSQNENDSKQKIQELIDLFIRV